MTFILIETASDNNEKTNTNNILNICTQGKQQKIDLLEHTTNKALVQSEKQKK